ncbi:FAD-dependent oxidoreductase [Sulfurospirillum sp. 1307]
MIFDTSCNIKGKVLKNRYVVAPVKTAYATLDGLVNDRHLRYYENIASGGAGMIIIEPVSVSLSGKEHPKQLNIHVDNSVESLGKLVTVIKKHGAVPAINLNHAGRGANKMATKMDPLAPSPILCPMSGLMPKEITKEEIKEILNDYKNAIKKALKAGFEAIELQCGHGGLIHQFLSARLNKREDEYGKDRTLFLKEVLEFFKNIDNVIKIVRISGSEFVEDGWKPQDNKVVIDLVKEYGFDMVHCGFGNACDTPPWYYSHMALPEDKPLEVLKAIKSMSDLPVIAVGRMGSVEKIEKLEKENLADFVAFGRPIVADSELVNKLVEKKYEEIDYCGYCLQGCLYNVKKGVGLGCIINPEVDKEKSYTCKESKKIAVIGAGPAGLTSAITLKNIGHKVTLFEKESYLGGNFVTAPKAIGKESMKRPLESLVNKAKRVLDDIRLNTDVKDGNDLDFDYFIVASGSTQKYPDIKGLDTQNVISSLDYFHNKKVVKGKRVLILGAGMVGIEAAENLFKAGFDVTITKRGEEVGNDMEPITKKLMMMRLEKSTINIMTKTSILAFEKDKVLYEKDGIQNQMKSFDTVIVATGLEKENSVEEFLKSIGKNFSVIGDAKEVANIYEATKSGYEEAMKFA